MPEWPDLAVTRRRLDEALRGREVVEATELKPLVLRLPIEGPLGRLLIGRRLSEVGHRGKFVALHFDDGAALVVQPMLTGVFSLKAQRGACIRLRLGGGTTLDYLDPKRMGKVYYLAPRMAPEQTVPGYAGMGPEASLADVGFDAFVSLGRRHRCEVRNLLLDQGFLAGIGNAYADEILWAARLHPKRRVHNLDTPDWRRLYEAVRETIAVATAHIEAELPADLGVKVRDHVQVRGRAGEPCVRCGATIVRRHLGYLETDFCPRCQPDPSGHFPVPEAGQGW